MKKCLMVFIFLVIFSSQGYASSDIVIKIDGRQVSFSEKPFIEKGRVLVPLRETFELLGASVQWDDSTKTISANKGNQAIKLQIGAQEVDENNSIKLLADVPPQIKKGRTFIPLRLVSETLGGTVGWDSELREINIYTSKPTTTYTEEQIQAILDKSSEQWDKGKAVHAGMEINDEIAFGDEKINSSTWVFYEFADDYKFIYFIIDNEDIFIDGYFNEATKEIYANREGEWYKLTPTMVDELAAILPNRKLITEGIQKAGVDSTALSAKDFTFQEEKENYIFKVKNDSDYKKGMIEGVKYKNSQYKTDEEVEQIEKNLMNSELSILIDKNTYNMNSMNLKGIFEYNNDENEKLIINRDAIMSFEVLDEPEFLQDLTEAINNATPLSDGDI